jgi:sugar phosphate isomerase/epimerase
MKRISIGSWAYSIGPYEDKPVGFDEVCQKLSDLKFDGVEIGGFSIHPSPDTMPSKEERAECVAKAEALGLGFSGFVPNLWGEKLLNTEDTTDYLNQYRRGLEFAGDIGVKGLRVDCVQPPTILDEMDEEVARRRLVSTWQRCCDESADQGCYVTWEFEPGFAFNKPSQVLRVIDEVNRDNFGVQFDTCHAEMVANIGARQPGEKETLPGGALEMAQKLRGKINHIHLIDSDGTLHGDETSSHPPFGEGYLNFDELVPELAKNDIGHDWWTVDLCFWPSAWEATEKCKIAMDGLVAKYG